MNTTLIESVLGMLAMLRTRLDTRIGGLMAQQLLEVLENWETGRSYAEVV